MKFHEETWTADGNRLCRDHGKGPFAFARFDIHYRVQLAAQAPPMAHELLHYVRTCSGCEGTRENRSPVPGKVCPQCRNAVAILTDAGVLP
jgi:hypothetical protein